MSLLVFQGFWLFQTWDLKEEEFHHDVSGVLHQVAEKIAEYNNTDLPKSNLIKRRSSNFYSVNVNSAIDANVLEDYLVRGFTEASIITDFEYAVYDCSNDEYLYSNYCNLSAQEDIERKGEAPPKFDDLIYYFVVEFPSKTSYLINDMRLTVLFSLLTILSVLTFMYAIWVIVRQKQVTDLQKDFINNMTHEFKTPISSIKLASEYLLKSPTIKKEERISKYAAIIKDQNDRLNHQVEKVLNIARLERDKFKLNLEELDLNGVIEGVIEQEKIKFEDNQGRIEYAGTTESTYVKADQLHLTNVVSNILDNALKYCEKNPNVKVELYKKSSWAILKIKDNGIGIEKDNLRNIFNKFYRVSTGNVHNVKGFGLGLFYVKNICDAHGWEIDIKSILGTGTQVEIKSPLINNKE